MSIYQLSLLTNIDVWNGYYISESPYINEALLSIYCMTIYNILYNIWMWNIMIHIWRNRCLFFQDLVLHNIMTIFTFMGANVLRQDDSYSFEIIKKTIDAVIPTLLVVSSSPRGNGIDKKFNRRGQGLQIFRQNGMVLFGMVC